MDSRSFIFGAACGAILGVGAGWVLGNDAETEATSEAELEPIAASVSNLKRVESTAPKDTQAGATVANPDAPGTPTAKENRIDDAVPWPANQWQELELEPKDDSWGYYMEQTLLQFLGSHPSIAQFDISRVECRTTKCQVEVIGYDESTAPVWEQVMYDMRQQPWSEFGQYGSSSGTIGSSFVIVGTLWRVPKQE
jgi:hypothetical protein